MPRAAETYRLFFALWPEAEVATQIYQSTGQALKTCNGRRIPAHQLHITLAFIGSVDAEGLYCLQQAAGQVGGEPFELRLDQLGYWSRPQIVWLAPTIVPPTVLDLQATLCRTLAEQCAWQPEARPFAPHLSLMRKVRQQPEAAAIVPVTWPVQRFSLLRSQTHSAGVAYEVLKDWPLKN